MALPTKEERIRRKKVMLAAGISVPNTDDSWGPWWEEKWKKATTHTKTNAYYGNPSVWNLIRSTWDNVTGNTTYEAEPQPIGGTLLATDESVGALIKRTLSNWLHLGDPVRDIVMLLMPDPSKPVKVGKAVAKAAPLLIKSVPKLFTKEGAKKAMVKTAKTLAKETPKATVGYVGGKGVDEVSKAVTGKSWAENAADKMSDMAGFHIEPVFGEMTNPGYGYGYFVGNNFSNLGRYTLDNLRPWAYSFNRELLGGLAKTFTQPFYKTPPTFFTHRPRWYTSNGLFLESRFENGANWARIPETEVPRVHFTRNSDGSISPTHIESRGGATKDDFIYDKTEKVTLPDDITPGYVGGEHSDYTYLGDDLAGNSFFLYYDRQKLNPQWMASDWIKRIFHLKEESPYYSIVHKLGNIDLSPLLGYRPFDIKFIYGRLFDPRPVQMTDAILIKNAKEAFTNPKK